MVAQDKELIFNYWKKFVITDSELIKDWFLKEDRFLKDNICKNSIVLDVGVGYGRSVVSVAGIVKSFIGIDNSKSLLTEMDVLIKQYSNLEVFCEDAKKMHFSDNYFDYILCLGNTFGDFSDNRLTILREMKRVLKKDGKLFVSVYSENAIDFRIKEYERIGINILKIDNGDVYTQDGLKLEQFNKNKLKKIFNDAGFVVKIKLLNKISYMCVATK